MNRRKQISEKVFCRIASVHVGKIMFSHPLCERFLRDAAFRTKLSLYFGFAINLLYAMTQLVFGICCRSLWSGALAVYYALLAVLRFQLLKPAGRHKAEQDVIAQLRQYRRCGIVLLFMTPLFASVLILVVHKNSGAEYPGMIIYLMAIYAFYNLIFSAINVVRYRKYNSPTMLAAKIVSLTAAFMSILSLETAILARFDCVGDAVFRQGMTGTTGGAVCVLVLGMAIHMTARATKELNALRTE